MGRLALRVRLTVIFGVGYLLTGVLSVAVSYLTVSNRIEDGLGQGEVAELLGDVDVLPPDAEAVTLPDGRPLSDLLQAVRQDTLSEMLRTMLLWSGVSVGLVAVLALTLGWHTSRRALEPVRSVTETARSLSAHDLSARVGHRGPNDDIAELARTFDAMLDRIEASVNGQRQFAAMASHELRTPLARLKMTADLAAVAPQETTVSELAATVSAAVDIEAHLVHRLLELSRSQAGVRDRQLVDLNDLVRREVAARRDERPLRWTIDGRRAPVEGDPALLRSMVGNLVENAVRHNVDGGSVQVVVENDPSRIVVRNTGPVVEAESLARIGEPFHRAAANPDHVGHGIGLTIVRSIATAHGAEFALDPAAGGGLVATVTFAAPVATHSVTPTDQGTAAGPPVPPLADPVNSTAG